MPSEMRFVSHETESDFKQCVTNEFDFGLGDNFYKRIESYVPGSGVRTDRNPDSITEHHTGNTKGYIASTI
jgi:hypothetical protein